MIINTRLIAPQASLYRKPPMKGNCPFRATISCHVRCTSIRPCSATTKA